MSVVDEVKDRLDIVEVIQSYVPLKKAGRTYKGLCPFHAEKTPSFVVFPDTGSWHCFGACGTGGDIYDFIQKQENVDFGEALKLLARRAGVEVRPPSPEATAAEQRLTLLREINQAAATYFHHLLRHNDEAATARAYLGGRGLDQETLDRFQVGYALDRWDALQAYLIGKAYALADLVEAGLVIEGEGKSGAHDRFRGRIVFPIRDPQARTIGFGGRVLGDGVPKYLNSPQTPLFDKGSVLFGLDQARKAIRATEQAVIVEGYMDVLMAHQHGFTNVVAQMGTALTEAQLRQLKRYARRFILALDSDVAGDQATLRGLEVARQVLDRDVVPVPTPQGLIRFEDRLAADIRIASLPPGRDPDEVIRDSPSRWTQLIASAKPLMEYYFQTLTADLDLGTANGKVEAVRALGPLVAELGDRVQRTHYLQQLARMVQVDERTLWQQIQRTSSSKRPARPRRLERSGGKPEEAPLSLDGHCLSFALCYPDLLAQADEALRACEESPLGVEDLARADDRAILTAWRKWLANDGAPQALGDFYDSLDESLQDRLRILVQVQQDQPEPPEDLVKNQVLDAITRLRLQNLRRQNQETLFLLEDAVGSKDREAARAYRLLIKEAGVRFNRLYQALGERSISGRRLREDAAVRVPFAEE